MPSKLFCKLVYNNGKIVSQGPNAMAINIDQIIEEDKKFGTVKPRNGKYFTFRVLDVNDKEIDHDFVVRAEQEAFRSFAKRVKIDVKLAKPWEKPDFKTIFRTAANDERGEMTDNTIMYHYFPIHNFDDPRRGLCVVNPKYYYTAHGKPMPMHVIDPEHYDESDTQMGPTIDFDAVMRHERGHGFGLPHDPKPDTTMSTPYPDLNEFLDERTIYRMIKKYGYRPIDPRRLIRWLKYIWHRSEHY